MANRDRHRQGLVYGPVRPSGPRDRGRILGNLLGFLVVLITAALLGGAIYLLIQSRGVEPVPPTPTAELTPLPTGSIAPATDTGLATSAPTVSPTNATSAQPSQPGQTPAPTLFVPPVVTGPGYVTFGTTVDAELHVTDPKTTFALDEPMVWSADLTEPANSTDLTIRILKQDASRPSGKRLIREDEVKPDVRNAQIFFRRLKPIGSEDGAGLFTIEYVRGADVLASGSFLVQ